MERIFDIKGLIILSYRFNIFRFKSFINFIKNVIKQIHIQTFGPDLA